MNVTTKKPTFSQLCDMALLRHGDIMRRTGLTNPTVTKLFRGEPVKRHTLRLALREIGRELHTSFEPEDVDAPTID